MSGSGNVLMRRQTGKSRIFTRELWGIHIDSIKLFGETLLQVFIVCQSDFLEHGTNAADASLALSKRIENFTYELSYEEDGGGADENHHTSSLISERLDEYNCDDKPYETTKFVNDIYNLALHDCQILSISDFPNPNPYKFLALVDHPKSLACQFITFTNVVDQCYEGIPTKKTSCPSEIRFGILKTEHGLKSDQSNKLVLRHVKVNRGESLLVKGHLKRQILVNEQKANASEVSSDSESNDDHQSEFFHPNQVVEENPQDKGKKVFSYNMQFAFSYFSYKLINNSNFVVKLINLPNFQQNFSNFTRF